MKEWPMCRQCRIDLEPWSPTIHVWTCPCCHSQYRGGDLYLYKQKPCNDFGTGLCQRDVPWEEPPEDVV